MTCRHYFEYLATNAQLCLRSDLAEDEKTWLEDQKRGFSKLSEPNAIFVNPLSVEVLLLCEDNRKLVLGQRSKLTAIRPGTLTPSASETVSLKDAREPQSGVLLPASTREVDLCNSCFRALEEEVGIPRQMVHELCFTSLMFDRQEYDYELTAYAVTHLGEKEVQYFFDLLPGKDKWEHTKLSFRPFPIEHFDASELGLWTHQAFMAYCAALYRIKGPNEGRRLLVKALGEE